MRTINLYDHEAEIVREALLDEARSLRWNGQINYDFGDVQVAEKQFDNADILYNVINRIGRSN